MFERPGQQTVSKQPQHQPFQTKRQPQSKEKTKTSQHNQFVGVQSN